MKPEHPKIQPELSDFDKEELMEKFFRCFDGIKLKNSDGLEVNLTIRQSSSTFYRKRGLTISPEAEYSWILEFQGYPGESSEKNAGPRPPENFVRFSTDIPKKFITIEFAKLDNPVLKNKNIFPQVLELIGKNFPPGFVLKANTLSGTTTDRTILTLYDRYTGGKATKDELENILLKYLKRLHLDSYFNKATFHITGEGEVEISLENIPGQTSIQLEINEN